jgi:hypothetical protein
MRPFSQKLGVNMLRTKQANFTLIALAAILASSCGGDKSLDEYQRQESNQNLAQAQVVAGTFRGLLTKQGTSQNMGALEVQLQAVPVPVQDGTGTGSVNRAVIQGNVRIVYGAQETTASLTQGAFLPSDDDVSIGSVSGSINVNLGSGGAAGSNVAFTLSGTYNHGNFSGTITPTGGVTGTTGSFNLQRDAAMPTVGQGSILPTPDASKYYAGTYANDTCVKYPGNLFCQGADPNKQPVTMTVNENPSSSGYAFVNLFADIKTYIVQLNFGTLAISLPTAELNTDKKTLTFEGLSSGNTIPSTLSCQATNSTTYNCSYRSEGFGTTLKFTVQQTKNPPR